MTVADGAAAVGPSNAAASAEADGLTPVDGHSLVDGRPPADGQGQAAPVRSESTAAPAPVARAAPVSNSRTAGDRARARKLFADLVACEADTPERARIRDELVEMHLPLVEYLARRFRNRGEPLDDLVQVATIGLIKSVDRFDLERGVEFSTYATPTIVGEIKRHFRDKGWAIRVPRRLQELKLSLTKATSELSQKLGRSPTVAELASHLEMTEEEVLEGLESANAYSAWRRRRIPRGRRISRIVEAAARSASSPGEAHFAAAVLRQHDAVTNRGGFGHLANARLALAGPYPHPVARRAAR
jgi:RNA polymerase sigma-B factor